MDNIKLTELQDYYDRLEKADWFYDFSDDGRVYRNGLKQFTALKTESLISTAHHELYDGFKRHYFSGKPWGTEKSPKPTRPT